MLNLLKYKLNLLNNSITITILSMMPILYLTIQYPKEPSLWITLMAIFITNIIHSSLTFKIWKKHKIIMYLKNVGRVPTLIAPLLMFIGWMMIIFNINDKGLITNLSYYITLIAGMLSLMLWTSVMIMFSKDVTGDQASHSALLMESMKLKHIFNLTNEIILIHYGTKINNNSNPTVRMYIPSMNSYYIPSMNHSRKEGKIIHNKVSYNIQSIKTIEENLNKKFHDFNKMDLELCQMYDIS